MNPECAIRGHIWFWRWAMRMLMCRRCGRLA
jgi:hypothetical protein